MKFRATSPAASEGGYDIAEVLTGGADDLGAADSTVTSKAPRQQSGEANGTDDASSGEDDDEAFIAAQQAASNRAAASTAGGQKHGRKSGGFQSMGLNQNLLKAITRKGFSVPTPIQRKAIPLILDHKDVVGMARPGSGKTAAFVIPMIERLKTHSVKVGARAILLSPSRELALQTLKTVKELGRATDLRTILLVGGDSLEDQFSQMTSNPDVIIATPGRFLHLLVEMSLDLSSVRYVVFDEADRLFEMGFASQLTEILHALPPTRQTLLFSATLPKSLVEFAKAGLKDPSLVRLDAESKISPDLKSAFFTVKPADKEGALMHLIKDVIRVPAGTANSSGKAKSDADQKSKKRKRAPESTSNVDSPTTFSTIIFTATKYHVEYISTLVQAAGYSVSYVYGSLDQTARKIMTDRFRSGDANILVVTDIAARGIDIPMLANVINYDFPAQPKVFVHRVGRTARAGRQGWAYTLVQDSDIPYLLDLQLFLGRKLVVGRQPSFEASFATDMVIGGVPTADLETGNELVTKLMEKNDDLQSMKTVAGKGEKQYTRSRNAASKQSARRAKEIAGSDGLRQANLFYEDGSNPSRLDERDRMLATISKFKPQETVFELSVRGQGGDETSTTISRMRAKIKAKQPPSDPGSVEEYASKDRQDLGGRPLEMSLSTSPAALSDLGNSSDDELEVTLDPAKDHQASKAGLESWQDVDHFMGYEPKSTNMDEDRAYGVHSGGNSKSNSFMESARGATLDLGADESRSYSEASRPSQMRWDKRSKKYVSRVNDEDGSRGAKMVRGESGHKIAASFKSGRYDAWKRSHRLERMPRAGEVENARAARQVTGLTERRFKHKTTSMSRPLRLPDKYRDDYHKQRKKVLARTQSEGQMRAEIGQKSRELKDADDVRKQRALKQKRREKNARPSRKRKGA